MSRFFQDYPAGGFRLDSPVKVPVASEMPRCAPPYTNRAREEPCQGGAGVATGPYKTFVKQSHAAMQLRPNDHLHAAKHRMSKRF